MGKTYLFRIDGAKDNDAFFERKRGSASVAYAGRNFCVGSAGWAPDLLEIVISEGASACLLRLIELEATKASALVSCRKYIPEDATQIVSAFKAYLDVLIRECKSTADPRGSEFSELNEFLSRANSIRVKTAGALRSSEELVEDHFLLNQSSAPVGLQRDEKADKGDRGGTFRGELRLSADRAKALSRCVKILDAVIRNEDHSSAAFTSWSSSAEFQPLKRLLARSDINAYPMLRRLILKIQNTGFKLAFEELLCELLQIWSGIDGVDLERARSWVSGYYPIAYEIKPYDRMPDIFEKARLQLAQMKSATYGTQE